MLYRALHYLNNAGLWYGQPMDLHGGSMYDMYPVCTIEP